MARNLLLRLILYVCLFGILSNATGKESIYFKQKYEEQLAKDLLRKSLEKESNKKIINFSYKTKTSCGNFSYGEVEDYTLNMVPANPGFSLPELLNIKAYPISASEKLSIELIGSQYATIELISSNGEIVKQLSISNSIGHINVANLPGGLYYVKVTTEKSVEVMKVVVK